MTNDNDVLLTLVRYAPDSAPTEWSRHHADETLLAILGDTATAGPSSAPDEIALQPRPAGSPVRHRYTTRVLPLAASVVVLVAAALVALLAATGNGGGRPAGGASGQPFGPAFTPPKGLSSHALGRHRFFYRYVDQFDLDASGRPVRYGKYRADAFTAHEYTAYDGDVTSIRRGSQNGCERFAGANASTGVRQFADRPTSVGKLRAYYLHRVNGGSGGRDAAVFSEISDDFADAGLASPKLRAAMLAVASRTPGVRLHRHQHDLLGRPAIRVDFVDPPLSGALVESLYLDPSDNRPLEYRESDDAAQSTSPGPSPAYTAAPPTTSDDPENLTGQGVVELVRVQRVVKHAPHC